MSSGLESICKSTEAPKPAPRLPWDEVPFSKQKVNVMCGGAFCQTVFRKRMCELPKGAVVYIYTGLVMQNNASPTSHLLHAQ